MAPSMQHVLTELPYTTTRALELLLHRPTPLHSKHAHRYQLICEARCLRATGSGSCMIRTACVMDLHEHWCIEYRVSSSMIRSRISCTVGIFSSEPSVLHVSDPV